MLTSKLRAGIAVVLALGYMVTGYGTAKAQGDKASILADAKDRYGDPLPLGAIGRLGTVRFRHGSTVTGLEFTADGKTVISGSYDKTLRIWDAATGRELRRLTDPGIGSLSRISASADGKVVAAQCRLGGLWVIYVASGRFIRLPERATCLALSPDGKMLATATSDVCLWDLAKQKLLRRCPGHKSAVQQAVFSPDGRTLATGDEDGAVRLWDPATGKEAFRCDTEGAVSSLALSGDGQFLATGGADAKLRLWNVGSGELLHTSPAQGSASPGVGLPVTVAVSPDGKCVASGVSGCVSLWDVASRKVLRKVWGPAAGPVAFSPDGKMLATCGHHCIRLWEVSTGKERESTSSGHEGWVRSVAVSADGKVVATGGGGQAVRLWQLPSGKELSQIDVSSSWFAGVAALSPDGRTIATDKGAWNTTTGHLLFGKKGRDTAFLGQNYSIEGIAFSPDGRTLAMSTRDIGSGKDRMIRLWDAEIGKELRQFGAQPVHSIAYSGDGKTLAAGNGDGTIGLWESATGKELRRFKGHRREVNSVAFSPDSKVVASSSRDGDIFLWDASTGKELRRLGPVDGNALPGGPPGASPVLAIAFSPNGRALAAAGQPTCSFEGESVTVWELSTGDVRLLLMGHQGDVNAIAFAGDSRTLVSGSSDTTALVWDLTLPPRSRRAEASRLSKDELAALWTDLGAQNSFKGYRAICNMVALPTQSVALLTERLHPVKSAEPKLLAQLLTDLDSGEYKVREAATRELEKLGAAAEPALRKTLTSTESPEVRRRAEGLLAKLNAAVGGQRRAIEVLEYIGAEAQPLLKSLAAGDDGAWLTHEAKGALQRLEKRPVLKP